MFHQILVKQPNVTVYENLVSDVSVVTCIQTHRHSEDNR
jgi:hypothetical protein